ncbi:ABC transporter permease [Dactylosporangium sp. AC04546]|uniref:ABC transporter permease n=1 Tax=Dactylosporangium sp. AC04546 TaxID=2862460 RepID=UPI001EDF7CB9|nr:ABC transporter permease [Dactylosporangium sp. AC04546]WVK87091.1 ABC transporter permease [Dactylosporangium sp. AC04546]
MTASHLTTPPDEPATATVAATALRQPRRRIPLSARIAMAFLALVVLGAILGPIVAPYSSVDTDLANRLLAPGERLTDGSVSLLGTDQLGRDMLAQILAGSRVSVIVGLLTVVIGGFVGLVLGLLAGYFGGWTDTLISRVGDIQLAFPSVLLAILIAGVLGPSLANIVIALAVTRWIIFARVARASAISVRGLDYVDSARVLGAGHLRILIRYIMPSCWASLLVAGTAQIGLSMVAEASLSFLGLGVPVSMASWGSTIASGRDYLSSAWWISTLPGIVLALVVVAVGLISNAYRDLTDPRAAL